MSFKIFSLFVLLASFSFSRADADEPFEENGVWVLSDDNFEQFIAENAYVLVEFYAPWCGHCKQLAPEYDKAAEDIKSKDLNAVLAKVDATVNTKLSEEFEVKGYPTLKFFGNGEAAEYDGGRTANEIVDYIAKKTDPNYKPPPNNVVVLTQMNFDEFINKEALTLVEFYAPWCGHCKTLEPKYEQAATTLLTEGIRIAKIDATVEILPTEKYGVEGYPTLIVFRNGKNQKFKGDYQSANGIIEEMRKLASPASKELKTPAEITNAKKEATTDIQVIGFFKSPESPFFINFEEFTEKNRDTYPYSHTFDGSLSRERIDIILPTVLKSSQEPATHSFTQSTASVDDIEKWIVLNDIPLVGEYTNANAETRYSRDHLSGTRRPLCIFFFSVDLRPDHRSGTMFWHSKIVKLATRFLGRVNFAIADDEKFESLLQKFGLDDSSEEVNLGCFDSADQRYPMSPPLEEWDIDEYGDFINKLLRGDMEPLVKSGRAPKKQTGPVYEVVADNFAKALREDFADKDVMVFIYAPWCGHCKYFMPIYEDVARRFAQTHPEIVFTKIDATENDLPPWFVASGYPTIYLSPPGSKSPPARYEGDRSEKDLIKFMAKHALKAKFDKEPQDPTSNDEL